MLKIIPFGVIHLQSAAEVLNHYILHTTATFHKTLFDLDRMSVKVGIGNDRYATFALLDEETFVGYAIVMPWKLQEAYRYTAEVTIYLHPDHLGQAIGSKALAHLESVAISRGLNTLIAGVCSENERSLNLFTRSGYERVAFFPRIGNKFGRELDMIYLQKRLSV